MRRVKSFVCIWFFWLNHPSLLPLDLWQPGALLLPTWSVCCAAWLRVLKHIGELWVQLLLTLSGLARASCRAGKGLALLATNQLGKQACVFKGWASPLWFTAPTETKLGTATVSAPGPLSSSQDELFAEDIQMYKEQIRLTQSSFAQREEKKEKRTGWLQKDLFPSASWMSERAGEWKQPCVFKVLIHNLFL